jgi:sec-independent protein translocase protein TatC
MTQSDHATRPPRRGPLAGLRANPAGNMTILEHLGELRRRLIRCVAIVAVATVAGFFLFEPFFGLITAPFCDLPPGVRQTIAPDQCFVASGVSGAFTFQLRASLIIGVVISAPLWLYQAWAFLAPGLHRRERRWAYLFTALALPLFAAGVGLAYLVLSKAFAFLLSFTPDATANLVGLDEYLTWVGALLLIFGISFEAPLMLVLLNAADVLRGRTLWRARRGVVIGLSGYAAIVTPGQDIFSMLALFIPMLALFELAALVCVWNDRRLGREAPLAQLTHSPAEAVQPSETL